MTFRAVQMTELAVIRLLNQVDAGSRLQVPDPFHVKLDAGRRHVCCKLVNTNDLFYLDLYEYFDLSTGAHLGAIYRAQEEFFDVVLYLSTDDDLIAYRLDNPCLNAIEHLVSSDPGEALPGNWWTVKVFDPS